MRLNSDTNVSLVFTSAHGRNAQQAGATGGLIGIVIGASVAANAESGGMDIVRNLCRTNGLFEAAMITNSIQSRLLHAGLTPPKAGSPNDLIIEVQTVGLLEPQQGFWVPYVHVLARLDRNAGGDTWSTRVSSTGTKYRRLDEFSNHPELYAADFAELAEDVARQVVDGPIRP